MKWLLRGFLVVMAVLTGVGALAVGWLHTSLPWWDRSARVAGLGAEVEIRRDGHGVPHIFARSIDDAYSALGFAHAQDRLWQMEMMRRQGAGRLAEVLGEPALSSDRFMRVLGLYRLAERQYGRLLPSVRRALDAYAAGVNAWIAGHTGLGRALPIEFHVLGVAPEPWRPADSLVWGKLMALRLGGNWRDELLRARLAGLLPPERIEALWPSYPKEAPVIGRRLASLVDGLSLEDLAEAIPTPAGRPVGASNAWVVSGPHSVTGKPILANDPHLGFSMPILWYLAHLSTPERELSGATVPGVPFTIVGHNGRIAWGLTTTQSDIEDLYVERLDPADSGRYLTPDGSRPLDVRRETIRVRRAAEVVVEVRETRHGPVIVDRSGVAGEDKVLSLAATYLRDGDLTPQAVHAINQARDWRDFVAAVADFHAPQQTILYADADGGIGFYAAGKVPLRKQGRGRVPAPGWTGEADWEGFIPFRLLPHATQPNDGRIVAANNRIVDDAYPYFLGDDWAPPYRAERIIELLGASAQSVDTTIRIQLDIVSGMARRLVPLMVEATENPSERATRVLGLLREWNGEMARRRPEPLIFTAWLRAFVRAVFADDLKVLFEEFWTLRPELVRHVLTEDASWCDDTRTSEVETCGALLAKTLEDVHDELRARHDSPYIAWRWGDEHRAEFAHPLLSNLPVPRWVRGPLAALLEPVIASDGGDHTVNRGAMRAADPAHPFRHIHGAGYRAVYDLADLAASRVMIATGQSGNPLSAHYADLVESWRDGRYIQIGQSRRQLDQEGAPRTVLTPP